jgi:hypothetical protein
MGSGQNSMPLGAGELSMKFIELEVPPGSRDSSADVLLVDLERIEAVKFNSSCISLRFCSGELVFVHTKEFSRLQTLLEGLSQ